MAISEEIIKLILDLQTTKDPADVAKKFDVLKDKINETSKAFIELDKYCDAAVTSTGQMQVALDKEVAAMVEATRAGKFFAEVYEEMAEKAAFVTTETAGLGQSMDRLKGSGGAGGMGILGVSYAFQDFTSVIQGGGGFSRALGSIQNNIPVILTGLGMTAGLAGAVSLVTVGMGAAIPILTSFAGKEKDVADAAEKATKELERQKKAADDLAGRPTAEQAETAKGVTEYLGMVGGENVRQAIGATVAQDPKAGLTDKEYQLMRDYEHAGVGQGGLADAMFPGNAADLQRLYKKRADAREARTDAIFGALPTDRAARDKVKAMALANPANFAGLKGAGFADELQSFEAEDQAQADARMKVAEEEGAAPHEAGVRRRRFAKEQNEKRKRQDDSLKAATAAGVDALDLQDREQAAAEKQAAADGKRAAAEAARKAAERARLADPSNQLRAFERQQQDAIAAEAMNQSGMVNNDPHLVAQVARQAAQDMPAVGQDIAAAVRMAVQQVIMKVNQDIQQQQMEIMNMGQDLGGMMPYTPTHQRRSR